MSMLEMRLLEMRQRNIAAFTHSRISSMHFDITADLMVCFSQNCVVIKIYVIKKEQKVKPHPCLNSQ